MTGDEDVVLPNPAEKFEELLTRQSHDHLHNDIYQKSTEVQTLSVPGNRYHCCCQLANLFIVVTLGTMLSGCYTEVEVGGALGLCQQMDFGTYPTGWYIEGDLPNQVAVSTGYTVQPILQNH